MKTLLFPPEPAAIENEITGFFAQNNFERSRRFSAGAYDPGKIRGFLEKLGNPQYRYKTIHVAGTAGKGSVTTYIARSLSALGFKTAAYLSPHFVSLRERFLVNDGPISAAELTRYWKLLESTPGIRDLSFFDALTALAFVYFAEEQCDWAVIETGLGGRRDSTNNLHAEAAVLTRIGFDHQGILGNSLAEIAGEKAGIIHESTRVFTVPQLAEAAAVIRDACASKKGALTVLEDAGKDYTEKNGHYAYQVIKKLLAPAAAMDSAIAAACATPIFGRWTELSQNPRVIFDGGHNVPAMEEIAALVNRQPEAECNFFLNTMRERNLGEFYEVLNARCGERGGGQKKLNFYLFPVADDNYHAGAAFMPSVDDKEISGLFASGKALNVFTGSMGLYKFLRGRFGL